MSLIRKDAYDIQGGTIASAATVDLEYTSGDLIDISGTTTITSIVLFGGHERTVRFTGALTLTHSSTLVLPGQANITTAAGDFAIFRGYEDGTVRCVVYSAIAASGTGDMILASVQTVTGAKTFGSAGAVGKLKVAGTTSGSTIIDATAVAGSGTVTLPTTGTLATLAGTETLSGKTLTNNIDANIVFCTTEFVAVTGTTGVTLTDVVGMGPLTVVAGGTYLIDCDIPCLATANSGLKLSFKYTTATMTTFQTSAMQWTAAGALTQEAATATSDQPDITSQTAALTYVHITGRMVVNAGGTIKFQAAQNAAHADETKVLVGASMRLSRVA